jgi:hypothetical protein
MVAETAAPVMIGAGGKSRRTSVDPAHRAPSARRSRSAVALHGGLQGHRFAPDRQLDLFAAAEFRPEAVTSLTVDRRRLTPDDLSDAVAEEAPGAASAIAVVGGDRRELSDGKL